MNVGSLIWKRARETSRDLAPIFLVIVFFQIFVIQQPFPRLGQVVTGAILVVIGLGMFLQGLEMGLFPIGESMAGAFARKGSVFWIMTFGFFLGFSTTVAEPALIAVSKEAAAVAAEVNSESGKPVTVSSKAGMT